MTAVVSLPEWACPEPGCDVVCVGKTLGAAAMKLYEHAEDEHGRSLPMCAQAAPEGDGWCVLPEDHTPSHESLTDPMTWSRSEPVTATRQSGRQRLV
jgi:hypothetical protein